MSIIGLIGPSATQPILDNLARLTPAPANDILSGAVKQVAGSRGGASVASIVGIAAAIWSASGYVGASPARRMRSTRCPKAGRSGSCGRCSWSSPR